MRDFLAPQHRDAVAAVTNAVASIRAGQMVVVVDDENRENEGDLVMAAEAVTPEAVNFMAQHGRGLICVAMSAERLDELDLPPMVSHNTSSYETGFTVSVDVVGEGRTGISAADRADTILTLCDSDAVAQDLARPGHVFPLRARPAGVLERRGHTEAATDLALLAGMQPAGVLCEVMSSDGSMARRRELEAFSRTHGLALVTIDDIVRYRQATEVLVECMAETRMPTRYGQFKAYALKPTVSDRSAYLALVMGDPSGLEPVDVRVHSECVTGDALGSSRCDCGLQLQAAMERIAARGRGVVLYAIGHEGRGIGIMDKMRAYALQDQGLDTVDANIELGLAADAREFDTAAHALKWLGVKRIRLLTNNPDKVFALTQQGLDVVERIPLVPDVATESLTYLRTKRDRLGHALDGFDLAERSLGVVPSYAATVLGVAQ